MQRASSHFRLITQIDGPLKPTFAAEVPIDDIAAFLAAVKIATDKLRDFGLSDDDFAGEIKLVQRKDGEKANGRYTPKTNLIKIFNPPDRGPPDFLWTVVHEVTHRLWVKHVDDAAQKLWGALCHATGKQFDPHAAEALSKSIESQPDKSSLWFYFKKHYGNDLGLFKLWLKTLKPSDSFPSNYASADPAEAFAEVGANVILGRGHAGREMKRSGSMVRKLFLAMVGPLRHRNSMAKVFEDLVEHAMPDKDENFLQTQVDFGYMRVSLPRWLERNVNAGDIIKIEHRPHATVYYGADKRDIDKIVQIMHDYGRPIRVSMGALNVFENPEMDVLYVELIGDSLVSLHNKIAKLPFARPSNRPQYIPHLTLAYLKKGAGRKFIGQSPFKRIISASGLTIIDSAGIEKIIRTQPDEVNQREPILLAGM